MTTPVCSISWTAAGDPLRRQRPGVRPQGRRRSPRRVPGLARGRHERRRGVRRVRSRAEQRASNRDPPARLRSTQYLGSGEGVRGLRSVRATGSSSPSSGAGPMFAATSCRTLTWLPWRSSPDRSGSPRIVASPAIRGCASGIRSSLRDSPLKRRPPAGSAWPRWRSARRIWYLGLRWLTHLVTGADAHGNELSGGTGIVRPWPRRPDREG
jgi:hypothetical protein